MKIINELPRLLDCLKSWERAPTREQFARDYAEPMQDWLSPMLGDFWARLGTGPFEAIKDLDWAAYRKKTLLLDPKAEEERLKRQIAGVEGCLGYPLEGEAILFGAFTMMDGYARFEKGKHRVFLGCDESFDQGTYLDILFSHELTHVIRETRPTVWSGWGLSPTMTHDEFTQHLPVAEHLANEGFSCVVSELLNPGEGAASYVYQTPESMEKVRAGRAAIDRVVHAELEHPDGDYGRLYDVSQYRPVVPRFAHYVWAWQWVKAVVAELGQGDMQKGARQFVVACSKDLLESARAFHLAKQEIV
jgi:hypothetical protein